MRKLVAIGFLTVDGVMQGLGSAPADTSGRFAPGGWGARFAQAIHESVGMGAANQTSANLFGRRTCWSTRSRASTATSPTPR